MPKCGDTDAVALMVRMVNSDAMKNGKLPVWTIYDHPLDYPDGFVARMHVSGKGWTAPANRKLFYDLEDLRAIFDRVGLICICRNPEDDVKIVESWL